MAVRAKDLPDTAEAAQAKERGRAAQQAESLRAEFSGRTWEELRPVDKEQLLRALAVHFGFIKPG